MFDVPRPQLLHWQNSANFFVCGRWCAKLNRTNASDRIQFTRLLVTLSTHPWISVTAAIWQITWKAGGFHFDRAKWDIGSVLDSTHEPRPAAAAAAAAGNVGGTCTRTSFVLGSFICVRLCPALKSGNDIVTMRMITRGRLAGLVGGRPLISGRLDVQSYGMSRLTRPGNWLCPSTPADAPHSSRHWDDRHHTHHKGRRYYVDLQLICRA